VRVDLRIPRKFPATLQWSSGRDRTCQKWLNSPLIKRGLPLALEWLETATLNHIWCQHPATARTHSHNG
jgi:hypothetical protein